MILKHFVALESTEVSKEYWVYIKKKQQLEAAARRKGSHWLNLKQFGH